MATPSSGKLKKIKGNILNRKSTLSKSATEYDLAKSSLSRVLKSGSDIPPKRSPPIATADFVTEIYSIRKNNEDIKGLGLLRELQKQGAAANFSSSYAEFLRKRSLILKADAVKRDACSRGRAILNNQLIKMIEDIYKEDGKHITALEVHEQIGY